MPATRKAVLGLTVVWCLFGIAGCGNPKSPTIKGTAVFPANITFQGNDSVMINFSPADPANTAGFSAIAEDKSFSVKSASGKAMLPGKYMIGVSVTPYDQKNRTAVIDDFNKVFGNPQTSGLTYELTAEDTQSITVDLVKKTVTKQ